MRSKEHNFGHKRRVAKLRMFLQKNVGNFLKRLRQVPKIKTII